MSANRVRARETKSGETVAYSEAAIRHNASAVEYCRTSMAALSGSTAGMQSIVNSIQFTQLNGTFSSYCRNHGTDRNHRICILFGVSIGFMVFIAAEDGLQLAKVFHRSSIVADTWLSRWPLHVCAVLDILVWNGSCVLVKKIILFTEHYQKSK